MFVSTEANILHADLDSFFASVEQRDDPRAAGRPVIVGGGGGAGGELRGEGVRRADGDGGRRARRAVPAGDRRPAALRGVLGGVARRCSRSSTTRRRWSRGCRSTRRSSTCAGCGGSRARRSRSRARLRARVRERGRAADHGRRGADEVPGQGRQRRGEAGRPAARRAATASSRSCTRCRSSGCGASGGQDRGQAARARHHHGGGGGASSRSSRWSGCSGRASGRHLHALAHNRDPRRGDGRRAAALDRRAARDRPARRRRRRSSSTRRWSALVDRDRPAAAGGAAGRAGP